MSGYGWHIVRVTIEALSPMSCGSGGQGVVDAQLVRDANGLPMIPGATIQGQLRRLCGRIHGFEKEKALFGDMLSDGSTQPGAILSGHGFVHDSNNMAVSGLRFPLNDALLEALAKEAPVRRDHVRLNHRHVAADAGKFDRAATPAGTRFSFELAMPGTENMASDLIAVAQLSHHVLFRPGAGRARGYGRVEVRSITHQFYTPGQAKSLRTNREEPPSKPLLHSVPVPAAFDDILEIRLTLHREDPWRIGSTGIPVRTNKHERYDIPGGNQPDLRESDSEPDVRLNPAHLAPTREPRIVWNNGTAGLKQPHLDNAGGYVAPGSGIRGPLAHRMLFHWNRGQGHFIKADLSTPAANIATWAERPSEIATMLGEAKGGATNPATGRASRMMMEDVALRKENGFPDILAIDHNSIDRFTGGTRRTALYSEELTVTGNVSVHVLVDTLSEGSGHATAHIFDEKLANALCHALRDLTEGRLALGAKSYGYFTGEAPKFTGTNHARWEEAYRSTQRIGAAA